MLLYPNSIHRFDLSSESINFAAGIVGTWGLGCEFRGSGFK